MSCKRITLLCGHYGSGKTNIAVNMALNAATGGEYLSDLCHNGACAFGLNTDAALKRQVALADLDIVNPYYRSLDSRGELEQAGIRVICSPYANTNLDAPALPQEMYALTDDRSLQAFIDVGGDDRGALALGRLRYAILEENDFEMILVINRFRPLTRTPQEVLEVVGEIQQAGGIPFTGIVNNSNLGAETSAETVLSSVAYGEEVSRLTGLPILATSVEYTLYGELKGKIKNLFPMKLQKRPV